MNGFDRYLASSPREGVFSHLDNQFTDPLSFLRELVQNSIDAGSLKVDVTCSFEDDLHEAVTCPGGVARGQLGTALITVTDAGEGMDRQTIDTRLTRLFSSDKEGDPSKIGRFGIGFSSVFAPKPDAVCVDTGRLGESWRLVFRPDRTFTRVRLNEVIDGTSIRLFKTMLASEYAALEQNIRRALLHDCPHVDIMLRYQGEQLNSPLNIDALDAPIKAATFEQGAEIVVGFTKEHGSDTASFYNRGLMLLVRPSEFPGMSYKVNSPRLRSALSRDNVQADDYYQLVLSIVRRLAGGPLVEELSQQLDESLRSSSPAATVVIMQRPLATLLRLHAGLPAACGSRAVACSPHGDLYSLLYCQDAARTGRLFAVAHPSPLSAAACAAGHVVLEDWQNEMLLALSRGDLHRLEAEYVLALPIKDVAQLRSAANEALRAPTLALLKGIAAPVGSVELGYLDYPGSGAGLLPAIVQSEPFALGRLVAALPGSQRWPASGSHGSGQSLAHSLAEGARQSLEAALASGTAHPVLPTSTLVGEAVTWVLNVDHQSLRVLFPLAVREPELAAYILIKMCLPSESVAPMLESDLLTLAMVRHCQRKEAPLTERLIALLTSKGVIDSPGTFTVNPDLARERIRRSRFPNPLGYVLDLVQAACIKGATSMSFRFGASDTHIRFDGEPFSQRDFEQIYSSLINKEGGAEAEARRLLGIGLCKAMQAGTALIQVDSGTAFVELRPDLPDRHVTRKVASPRTQIRLQQRLGLSALKRYLDHLGGHLTSEVLLQERCVHSRVAIDLDGRLISQGHTLSDARPWQTFSADRITGAVEVAPLPIPPAAAGELNDSAELALSPTLLRVVLNGVWVDTQLPIELAPGFRALAECASYELDVACQHIVQGEEFAATLRAVAATQVELLVTQCRAYLLQAASPAGSPPPPRSTLAEPHLRALLRGVLSRLGGLGPILRWANLPIAQFPPDTIAEGNPGWPRQIYDGSALIDVPIFPCTNGVLVSLRELLRDFVEHQTVAYSAEVNPPQDAKRRLVVRVLDLGSEALLRSLFGDALECVDSVPKYPSDSSPPTGSWRRPSYRLRLSNQVLIARVPLIGLGIAGEIGVEPHQITLPPWQRRLNQPCLLHLLFIKEGCLMAEKTVPFPVPDLTVVVNGDFTPSYLLGEVISDTQLAVIIDSIYNSLPHLIERMARYGEQFSAMAGVAAPPGRQDDRQAWWALVLRRLVILALSPEARSSTRQAMGIREPVGSQALPNAIPAALLWAQLQGLPLFEAIDGAPLRLTDLSASATRFGWISVLCPSVGTHPNRLENWASLCQTNLVPAEIWDEVHDAGSSGDTPRAVAADRPAFVLWLAPEEQALWSVLATQLAPAQLREAEPWLRSQAAWAAAAATHGDRLSLPEECQAQVPLLSIEGLPGVAGLEGMLGVVMESRFSRARGLEPRAVVSLLRKRHSLGSQEIWMPGGHYLSAIVDHPQLQMSDDLLNVIENDGLMQVRMAMAAALPRLFAVLVRRPLPWLPLCRAVLFEAVTALFPRPAFRAAYERLQLYCTPPRGPHTAEDSQRGQAQVEDEYLAILRLAVATSIDRTESVLEHHLLQAGPLPVSQVEWDVLDTMAHSHGSHSGKPDRSARADRASPPAGAMAWLSTLYPNTDGLPAAERVLCMLPVLAAAPLLMHCDGSPLSFSVVITDFRQYGQVLYSPGKQSYPAGSASRPIIHDPGAAQGDDVLRVLHCLFGAKNVQDVGAPDHLGTALAGQVPPGSPSLATADPALVDSLTDSRLLAAVLEELSSFSVSNQRLLDRVNPRWLLLDETEQAGAVVGEGRQCIINTRHPAVRLAQRHFRSDPQCVRFLALAVYSVLCSQIAGVDTEEAGRFHHHIAVRALSASRHPLP